MLNRRHRRAPRRPHWWRCNPRWPPAGRAADRTGAVHFGEHSLGWLALAGLARCRQAAAPFVTAAIRTFAAHAAAVLIKRVVKHLP